MKTQFNFSKVLCFEMEFGESANQLFRFGVLSFFEKSIINMNRKGLREMASLGYGSLLYDTPIDMDFIVNNREVKWKEIRKEFILQLNFRKQSEHEKCISENRLNDKLKRRKQRCIDECIRQRRNGAKKVENHQFLKLLIELLGKRDSCSRVLTIRQLAKSLTDRSELVFQSQLKKIQTLYANYVELTANNQNDNNEELTNTLLKEERKEFNEKSCQHRTLVERTELLVRRQTD